MTQGASVTSTLVLCGHSLGGAIAKLPGSVFQAAVLLTIGCPRVGNSAFASTLSTVQCHRHRNCCDVIVELIPASPWYEHVGDATCIDRLGAVQREMSWPMIMRDQMTARALRHRLQAGPGIDSRAGRGGPRTDQLRARRAWIGRARTIAITADERLAPLASRHSVIPQTSISRRNQPVMQTAQPALADACTET
jgi:hypothetical protein